MRARTTQEIAAYLISYANHVAMTDDEWDEVIANETASAGDLGETLWGIAEALAAHRRDLATLEAAIDRARARDVRQNGPVRYGDTWTTVIPDRKREIIDSQALRGWLEQAAEELDLDPADVYAQVWRLDNNNLRIGTLRGIARRLYAHREEDASEEGADDYAKLIEDTFIATKEGGEKLATMPITKAPQYAQRLEHGHRAGTFRNKKSDTPSG